MKGTILKTDQVAGAKNPILFWNLNHFEEGFLKKYKKKIKTSLKTGNKP